MHNSQFFWVSRDQRWRWRSWGLRKSGTTHTVTLERLVNLVEIL